MGSNTVHLLVVDAHFGAHPTPTRSHKTDLRLAELLDRSGAITRAGADSLVETVRTARAVATEEGVEDFLAFATSAVREARNGDAVIARVKAEAGVDLAVLPGRDEARLTFLAVRRWFGWSAGRLLCLDIGGGSLELASGIDEEPDVALSLPLGAGRVTREHLPQDPPSARAVERFRALAREQISATAGPLHDLGRPDRTVVTSKTFRSLARLTGAAPSSAGPRTPRRLHAGDLELLIRRIAPMTAAERAELEGVSPGRAHQLLAGALVASAALEVLDVPSVDLCPWALREGVVLRRLDWLADGTL